MCFVHGHSRKCSAHALGLLSGSRKAQRYVDSITERLTTKEQISPFFLLFIASLSIHPKSTPAMQKALMNLIDKIAQADALKAISLLPMILYKLGKSHDPDVQLKVGPTYHRMGCLINHNSSCMLDRYCILFQRWGDIRPA